VPVRFTDPATQPAMPRASFQQETGPATPSRAHAGAAFMPARNPGPASSSCTRASLRLDLFEERHARLAAQRCRSRLRF